MGAERRCSDEQIGHVENHVASGVEEKWKRNHAAGTRCGGGVGRCGDVGLGAVEESGVDACILVRFAQEISQFVNSGVGLGARAAVGEEEQGRPVVVGNRIGRGYYR